MSCAILLMSYHTGWQAVWLSQFKTSVSSLAKPPWYGGIYILNPVQAPNIWKAVTVQQEQDHEYA